MGEEEELVELAENEDDVIVVIVVIVVVVFVVVVVVVFLSSGGVTVVEEASDVSASKPEVTPPEKEEIDEALPGANGARILVAGVALDVDVGLFFDVFIVVSKSLSTSLPVTLVERESAKGKEEELGLGNFD